jgi:hypothetical protein
MLARKIKTGRLGRVVSGHHAGEHVIVGGRSAVEPGAWNVTLASGLGSFRVWPEFLLITGSAE